jgi:serine-type D-Ala-D-Ala carboxypeptidase/endopeptidase
MQRDNPIESRRAAESGRKAILSAAACCALACMSTPACAGALPSDAEITQMLQVRVDLQKQATGIVVGIAGPRGNRIVAYGARSLEDKTPANGDTVYDIGSITKVLTALLLADMAQRHDVALDDPAEKYLPGVTLPSRNGRQITLADLATHTSGLPLRPTNLSSKDPANPYAGYTRDRLFACLSTYKLTRDPGSHYDYSNVGFGLLGQVLSARAGVPYADLVARRITGPLHMVDTRMDPTAEMIRRAATGYNGALEPVPHWDMGLSQARARTARRPTIC